MPLCLLTLTTRALREYIPLPRPNTSIITHMGATIKSPFEKHIVNYTTSLVEGYYYYYYEFILGAIFLYTTGLQELFNQSNCTGTAPTDK